MDSPNILDKEGETIWFVGNKIKYSSNREFISNRFERAKNLKNFIPKMIDKTDNMYSYIKEDGKILSTNLSIGLFKKLLKSLDLFWEEKKTLNEKEKN